MTRVLFVCHGNICRSPMAEYVMKDILKKQRLECLAEISSAATSTEEIGNPVYPPVRRLLAEKGISCKGHSARQLTKADYEYYDMIIVMDNANLRNAVRMCGGDPEAKISMLADYSGEYGEIDDPWYTRDFESCYRSVLSDCLGLAERIKNDRQNKENK